MCDAMLGIPKSHSSFLHYPISPITAVRYGAHRTARRMPPCACRTFNTSPLQHAETGLKVRWRVFVRG
jgi:hypothetical protein